jgi:hypothetical protein
LNMARTALRFLAMLGMMDVLALFDSWGMAVCCSDLDQRVACLFKISRVLIAM